MPSPGHQFLKKVAKLGPAFTLHGCYMGVTMLSNSLRGTKIVVTNRFN
jgi:hypothetical protein